eukprot:CAMPEP_0170622246 /NCGR_PEP_ID=MMETSP0224-20130122/29026_1 /TAXON_ID=285029 /ORGANISM="Togula jolla, Strain CCCM 725" /LENGTH=51 /DNA_ID=CAMNT_0010948547 /DNA_START=147 /DNA_END=299 /DNA_ORIENTATION=-
MAVAFALPLSPFALQLLIENETFFFLTAVSTAMSFGAATGGRPQKLQPPPK